MDKAYADAVRLLLAAAPEVFANDICWGSPGTLLAPVPAMGECYRSDDHRLIFKKSRSIVGRFGRVRSGVRCSWSLHHLPASAFLRTDIAQLACFDQFGACHFDRPHRTPDFDRHLGQRHFRVLAQQFQHSD